MNVVGMNKRVTIVSIKTFCILTFRITDLINRHNLKN